MLSVYEHHFYKQKILYINLDHLWFYKFCKDENVFIQKNIFFSYEHHAIVAFLMVTRDPWPGLLGDATDRGNPTGHGFEAILGVMFAIWNHKRKMVSFIANPVNFHNVAK